MKKLPLSITTFADIRDPKEDYLYIDKTEIAYKLIDQGRYYFLSRPRRFGKSLFVDTLNSLFKGEKDLFKGLAIYDKWNWEVKYPVINLSLNSGSFDSKEGITERILDILERTKKHLGVDCKNNTNVPSCFAELI